jgi:signal transduction histidine kinase
MLAGAAFMLLGGVTTTASTILCAKILKGSAARMILAVASLCVLAALIMKDAAVIWANGRLDYLMWTFFYPLLAFYLLGARRGFFAVLGMAAVLAFILFVPGPGSPPHVNLDNLRIQYGISFLSTITGAYVYERTRMHGQAELVAKQEKLQESENRLRETIDALQLAKERSERFALQADKANRAKSALLAGMSHELRTPLNHIIGFTDLLLEGVVGGALTDVQREYLGDVASSGRHLLSLITDILDLSKVEAGKLNVRRESVNIRELLEHSLLMVRDRAFRHGIDTAIDFRDPPTEIVADQRMMKQILYNLLANAVKFTPDGGKVTVICSAQAGEGDRALVTIDVADTGAGLDADDLERIFTPFEQVDCASTAREGTGLGLALTKRMVELHGGRIWARSEGRGKGSTFHVSLPVEPGRGAA